MNKTSRLWFVLVVLVAIAAGAYLYMTRTRPPTQVEPEPQSATQAEVTAGEGVQHPIEAVEPSSEQTGEEPPLPTLAASDAVVEPAVLDLVDREAALGLLGNGDYIRKVVATVDNLPGRRASARVWPVERTPGRFTVLEEGGHTYLSPENYRRYDPFVRLATSADPDQLVALYVRYYPLFQQAFEELGYPERYFNDRLIDVIDHLLSTPDPGATVELVLPPQDPSVEVERPWVLYEYADPALQSLSAGQKILVRMGSDNAARIKSLLRALRSRLATVPGPAAGSDAKPGD
jgi:hypothetical protein